MYLRTQFDDIDDEEIAEDIREGIGKYLGYLPSRFTPTCIAVESRGGYPSTYEPMLIQQEAALRSKVTKSTEKEPTAKDAVTALSAVAELQTAATVELNILESLARRDRMRELELRKQVDLARAAKSLTKTMRRRLLVLNNLADKYKPTPDCFGVLYDDDTTECGGCGLRTGCKTAKSSTPDCFQHFNECAIDCLGSVGKEETTHCAAAGLCSVRSGFFKE